MNILFRDKKDISPYFKETFKDHFIVGGRETLTEEMLSSDVLSVKVSNVDNKIIKKMPNLKWVINRSHDSNNINLKHCKENNIGVITAFPLADKISDWIIKTIEENYFLPYYVVYGNGSIGHSLSKRFEYIKMITSESPNRKINEFMSDCNTLIITLPFTNETKGIIDENVFNLLPHGTNIISVSNGKVINNEHLLKAIKSKQINNVVLDCIDSKLKDELLDTGYVKYTKESLIKFNDSDEYTLGIKKYVDGLKNETPFDVSLERIVKEIDRFWD